MHSTATCTTALILALTLLTGVAAAQDDPLEGHSWHGEEFNEGPRQGAYLIEGTGNVSFPVSDLEGRLQDFFNQGIGQLHGFWYFEAERTFRQIAAEAPECAMAYWGMAMANADNPDRAERFAREAWLKRERADEREQMYIDALANFYEAADPEETEDDGEPKTEGEEAVAESEAGSEATTESGSEAAVAEAAEKAAAASAAEATAEGAAAGEGEAAGEAAEARTEAAAEETEAKEEDAEEAAAEEEELLLTRAEKEQQEKDSRAERDSFKGRAAQLVKDYEEILWEYPDDIEAKAFLANRLWLNRRFGHATPSRHAIEALLQQVLAVNPMHPAHHYRIHLWDAKDSAERVVDSAVKSGPSAPGIAHMWHMGGHIFARLGRHTDAAWQQEASARVDHAHMMRDWVLPDQIHNFAHNNEWLTRSLRHHGRVRESVSLASNMIELPRHPEYNTLEKRGCSASYGRWRLLETLEMFEQWEALAELADTMYLEPSEEAVDGALRAFALGKAYAHLGDDARFEEQIAALEAMLQRSKDKRSETLDEHEERALAQDFPRDDVRAVMEDVLDEYARELGDVRDKLASLRALRSALAGEDMEENLKVLEDSRFDKSHLARLHFLAHAAELEEAAAQNSESMDPTDVADEASDNQADEPSDDDESDGEGEKATADEASGATDARPADEGKDVKKGKKKSSHLVRAVELARKAAEDRDGQLYPHANLAYVLHEAGETEEALELFDELRQWTARADLDMPVFQRLAPLAELRELPADWRVEAAIPEDVGDRGELAELGPLRWTPPHAKDWSCSDAYGNQVSMNDYAGRPVLVIFFLGFECVHCVEQLVAFSPAYDAFREAGIEIVTIGNDPVEKLRAAFGDDPDNTGYPFLVLSDEEMEHFRLYRAYDDFEDMPLHGTFLVDGAGRVRWQDISYEPFMDWEFLLEESQRLLGLDLPEAAAAFGPLPGTTPPAKSSSLVPTREASKASEESAGAGR